MRPDYDLKVRPMLETRKDLGARFCQQILATCAPWLPKDVPALQVLEVGCGYGWTAFELASRCAKVIALEPCAEYADYASELSTQRPNMTVISTSITEFHSPERFDLVVLDNVYEHLPDQVNALRVIVEHMAPGGVLFLLCPNKLWPFEVHYGLPFLSYLPVPLADRYLRLTGRGQDYKDASYAPTYWGLRRALRRHPELEFTFCVPADLSLTQKGASLPYRIGAQVLERLPSFWAISKSLLVVATKRVATRSDALA